MIFLTGMFVEIVYADDLQCLRYDPKYFVASNKWVPLGEKFSSEHLIKPIEAVYLLKLPKLEKHIKIIICTVNLKKEVTTVEANVIRGNCGLIKKCV